MNSNFKMIKIQYYFCDEFIIFSMQSHVESDKNNWVNAAFTMIKFQAFDSVMVLQSVVSKISGIFFDFSTWLHC